jgi:hypothetical protein
VPHVLRVLAVIFRPLASALRLLALPFFPAFVSPAISILREPRPLNVCVVWSLSWTCRELLDGVAHFVHFALELRDPFHLHIQLVVDGLDLSLDHGEHFHAGVGRSVGGS